MHGIPFPKLTISALLCLVLICQNGFGQKKADTELNLSKCWSYPLEDATGAQIATDKTGVFLALNGGKIEALSRDGKKIWSSEFGGEISSNIIAADDSLFFTTVSVSDDAAKPGGGKLRRVSKETGITNWTIALPDAAQHYISASNGSPIVVSKNGVIESVDSKNGNVKWRRQISEGFVAEPSFAGDKVIVATAANQIFEVILSSGEIDSIRKTAFGVTALSAGANSELAVGDERGRISVLNSAGKTIWTFKSGGEISFILQAAGNFLVASHDNFIYFLATRNGGRVWKKRLAGRVGQMAKVNDGFALVSTFEERGAALFELFKGRTVGQFIFVENESLIAKPVAINGSIFTLTNAAVHAYSLTGCPTEKTKAVEGQ